MKKLGWFIAHYGVPYFEAALEALEPQVDHIVVLYTDVPSQGFMPDHPCPDEERDLLRIADRWADKITWVPGRWPHEGAHCAEIWNFAHGYDWLVRCDTDEIYPTGMVDAMIAQAETTAHKHYRIPFRHHWRAFNKVCRDGQMPVRLDRVQGGDGERYLDSEKGRWEVAHMGYAQPTKYIRYKIQVSGHRPEWRLDWFEDRWMANALEDVHPVCHKFWNVDPFDAYTLPPSLLKHPYFGLNLIE